MSSLVIGGIGVAALFGGILLGINVMVVLGLVGAFGLAALVGFNAATACEPQVLEGLSKEVRIVLTGSAD